MSSARITLKDFLGWSEVDLAPDRLSGLSASDAYAQVQAQAEAVPRLARCGKWFARKCQAVSRSSWTSTASGFSWRPGTRRGSCARTSDPAKYPPEDVVVVPLTKHKVESKHHPYLELSVDGKALGRLPFEIDLALTLEGVELTIQGGRIIEDQDGQDARRGHAQMRRGRPSQYRQEAGFVARCYRSRRGVLIPA